VFVDRATFEEGVVSGEFLEWAEFHGNLYGTPRHDAPDGRDVVLEIEVQGARQVRLVDGNAVIFLIEPPSMGELEARLRGRGDDVEHVEARLGTTPVELDEGRDLADFVVLNDDVSRATSEILSILETLRHASASR
jgi:guanylate kinase